MSMIDFDALRHLRRKRGLTIRKVADLIGKNPGTVWRYENGKTQVKGEVLFRLADLYGVDVSVLRK
ncbi:helix-turn-helix domain-containing protein [Dendrosporobacter sp. 1207_IL3150]|uniref:helix-turn-helix domain-containing protein n=1 Tax=Dendrosporobacter sp. 1207_IL3150 TaxID=3084054 RepID=UPI002FDAB496